MTTASLTLPQNVDQSELVMPKLSGMASTSALALVDAAGRTATAAEELIDTVAAATKVVVPATTRFLGAFLPIPEVLNRALAVGVGVAANIGSAVAATGAKCALQALTFGAPAWSQGMRRALAVSLATRDLLQDGSGVDILARSIAATSKHSLIREDLATYVNLRIEHRRSQEGAIISPERKAEVAESIATLEKRLSGYSDFEEISAVFNDATTFVQENSKRLDQISLGITERLLSRVESFYRVRLGERAGNVTASWETRVTPEERAAAKAGAHNAIGSHVLKILRQELTGTQITEELAAIKKQLHSVFGTYQALTKAALGVVGGVAYANAEFNQPAADTYQTTFSDIVQDISSQVQDTFEGFETSISESIGLTGGPAPFQTNTTFGVDSTGHVTEMESCISGAPSSPQLGVEDRSTLSYEPARSDSAMENGALSQQGQELLSESLPSDPEFREIAREILEGSDVLGATLRE